MAKNFNIRIKNIITSKLAKKFIYFLIMIIIVFDFHFFPTPVLAAEVKLNERRAQEQEKENQKISEDETKNKKNEVVIKTARHTLSAYTSEKAQCDDSPCITANGFNLCEHGIEDSVAANFLKFGTKIRIPELFGDRIFVVRDRMNKRYSDRVDVWMLNKADAKNFGLKYAKIEILEL